MSGDAIRHVLFLCTGNSARSILAEAILNRAGLGKFQAHSAGSSPAGRVHPLAIALLKGKGYATESLRSKSWDEFAGSDAPRMDLIVTVCDSAGRETCPVWPGHPLTLHWGVPDPAAVVGTDAVIAQAFADTYEVFAVRIAQLVRIPFAMSGPDSLHRRLHDIGQVAPGTM